MANKSVNVSLNFTAQTGQAKASIQELQTLLNKLGSEGVGINKNTLVAENKAIKEASEAAMDLQNHLNNAFNVKTGKFDLSLFDKSLKNSNQNITDLTTKLLKSGETGQQAFVKLAQSISLADQPMLKINNKLQDFAASLKKTMSWQLSNNVIRGFMGAIQTAYGYAQDLNASLTDIRIVTGKSSDEMAKFAEQANKAAKALSTTTTDYTKGSLIFFQQGLSDQEVSERTETTLKMANVTGDSTSKVADQMTAIWNNFDDGSKKLSYYADVLTALGAATASSSDEISEGINKFAATAKTVGLSYEYATAALATVTARTRESADVVGNSLKTLFARIQGLNQGDTLDDGTTLNKYSSALDKVGVNIKTTSGELKDMDTIIDELGPKWKTLADDQKMALAQTVAGVRQYSQFMALMNNYDYFKENVGVVEGAEGTLQEQADIYAESWEAASKRVRASTESLYQDLIDDKFFISINNGIANALSGLDAFIDKAGGLKTVITAVSGVFLSAFASKIPDALKTAKYNLEVLTGGSQKAYQNIFKQMQESTKETIKENNIDPNSSTAMAIKQANELAMVKNNYAKIQDKLSQSEQQSYQIRMQTLQATNEEALAQQKLNEETKKALDLQQESLTKKDFSIEANSRLSKGADIASKAAKGLQGTSGETAGDIFYQSYEHYKKAASQMTNQISREILKSFSNGVFNDTGSSVKLFQNLNFQQPTSDLEKMVNAMQAMANSSVDGEAKLMTFNNQLAALKRTFDPAILGASGLDEVFRELSILKGPEEITNGINKLKEALKQANIPFEEFERYAKEKYGTENIDKLVQGYEKVGNDVYTVAVEMEQSSQKAKDLMNFQPKVELSSMMSSFAGATLSAVSSVQQLKSGLDALTDPDLSGWEKFSAALSSVATSVFTIKTTIEGFSTVKKFFGQDGSKIELFAKEIGGKQGSSDGWDILHNVAQTYGRSNKGVQKIDSLIKDNETKDIIRNTLAINLNSKAKVENAQKTLEQTLVSKGYSAEQAKEIAQKTIESAQDSAHTVVLSAETKAYLLRNAAMFTGIAVATLAVGAIAAIKAAERKRAKEAEENATKIREEVDANKEIIDSNQELVNSYEQLNKKLKETQSLYNKGQASADDLANAQDSLKEKAKEVADALQIQGASLDILNSNWDGLQKKIESKQQSKIAKQIKEEKRAQEASENALYYSNKENSLSGVSGLNITGEVFDNFLNKKYTNLAFSEDGNIAIQDTSTGAAVAQGYESLQQLYDDLASTMTDSEKASSTILKNINSYLEANKEAYDRYKESEDNIQQLNIQSAVFKSFGGVSNASAISSVEEYQSYSQNMISFLAEQKGITDETSDAYKELVKSVEAYLGTLDGVGDFQRQSKALEDVAQKANIAKKDVQDFYRGLSKEEKTLFFSIDFDTAQTTEAFQKQLELLKTLAERNTIKVKIEAAESGIDLLGKSGATTDDWMTWAKQMREAYGEDFNFEEFLGKTEDEKNAYLQNLKNQGKDDLADNREKSISKLQSQIDQAKQRKESEVRVNDGRQRLQVEYQNRLSKMEKAASDYANGNETDFAGYDNITDLNGAIEAQQNLIQRNQELIDSYNGLDDAIEGYQSQINSLQDEQLIEDTFGWRDALKEEAEALNISYDEILEMSDALQDMANSSDKIDQAIATDEKAAAQLGKAAKQTAKGLDTLNNNLADWKKAIKGKDVLKQTEALDDMADAMADVMDISDELSASGMKLGEHFKNYLVNNLDLVEKAANGDRDAILELQRVAAEDIVMQITTDPNQQQALITDVGNIMTDIQSMLDSQELKIGSPIMDNAPLLASLNELINSVGMSVNQAQSLLAGLGFNAKVKEVDSKPSKISRTFRGVRAVPGRWGFPEPEVWEETVEDTVEGGQIGSALEIESGNYVGGGNISGAVGGTGSRSSGSGGSSKSTTHADTKSFSDKDRYHTVKNQLEDLNAQYDALDKAKDRAFGKSKLKEMDAEIAKTDELIDKQKEYLSEIEDYLPKDKAIMEEAYNKYIGGPGIEYDKKNGNISNYDAIQDAMFEKYNEMAGKYTEDSDEWKQFEKEYELLEKYIEQYEETYDLLRDERDKMQELINQKIDLGLEKVQYQVEIALDVPDDTLKVLEYRLGRLDDNASDAMESIGLLVQKMNEVNKKVKVNQAGLADLLKLSMSEAEITEILNGNFEALEKYDENGIKNINFTEDQIEAIKEYRDNLIDLNEELDDIRNNIEEKVMTVFDDWNDKLSDGIDLIDHYTNTLESYRNIIDIVGKDTLGVTNDFMGKLAQSTVDVAIDKLRTTKTSYEALVQAQEDAQNKLAEAQARNDQDSIDFWKETLTTIEQEVNSANEQMMQAWEDALSSIADNFENTINDLVDSFNKSIYSLGGLDGLSDEFSRQQESADLMLDDYQKIYELSKLSRDINKTIDDTDIISGKQKLKKLLGQINDLQADGNEMSKYDLEYLQKTYDLRLAEIELEEAQRAKNTVRLQKDSEGNWSYIYTQSSDAIDSAQQKYEDALYAMQDLSSNYIDEMSEKLISTSKDMEEALANIRVQDFASQEDYYKEVKRVQDLYSEQLKKQEDELNKAIKNNKELYDTDWKNYHDATGYKISDADNFAKSFKDTLLGSILGSDDETSGFAGMVNDMVDNLTLGLKQAATTYFANIEEAMKAAGTSTTDFVKDSSETITKVVEDSKRGVDSVNDMADGMKTAFDKITDYISNWQKTYGLQIKEIQDMNLNIVESFNEMLKALSVDPDLITVSYDFNRIKKEEGNETEASSYDTGGYTGEWDSSGKLAYLHQKELVLNKEDTSNILAAVQFTRSILDTIDLNAKMAALGLGTLSAIGIKDSNEQTLQQNVNITAEFPNVSDHTEIEEAMKNLINHASQYANRK